MNRTRTGGPLHANPDIITSAGRLVTLNGVDPGADIIEEIVLTRMGPAPNRAAAPGD
jgi:hypothetical protein